MITEIDTRSLWRLQEDAARWRAFRQNLNPLLFALAGTYGILIAIIIGLILYR